MTFVYIKNIDQCAPNPQLCPFKKNTSVTLKHVHPDFGWIAPAGHYRSRQVWRNEETKEALGCVDMEMIYARDGEGDETDGENEVVQYI